MSIVNRYHWMAVAVIAAGLSFFAGCAGTPRGADSEGQVAFAGHASQIQRLVVAADADAPSPPNAGNAQAEVDDRDGPDAQAMDEAAEPDEQIELRPSAPGPEGAVLDRGLQRDQWDTIETGAATGRVVHRPHYFEDCQRFARIDPLALEADVSRFRAALEPHADRAWTGHKFGDTTIQYGKWAVDTVLLPVRLIVTPPWTLVETPAEP